MQFEINGYPGAVHHQNLVYSLSLNHRVSTISTVADAENNLKAYTLVPIPYPKAGELGVCAHENTRSFSPQLATRGY